MVGFGELGIDTLHCNDWNTGYWFTPLRCVGGERVIVGALYCRDLLDAAVVGFVELGIDSLHCKDWNTGY